MPDNIEHLSSNILSILAKERELLGDGYQIVDIIDEHLLERGEYLVRSPYQEDIGGLRGWESMSIIWCTL